MPLGKVCMRFRVLGTLEVVGDSEELTPTTPKLRQVLALLLLRHNRIVQIKELVDELWGEDPPSSALATLQTYIYKLRKLLAEGQPPGADEPLRTKPNGYRFDVAAADLDLSRFGELTEQGYRLLEQQQQERATEVLSEALSLWRGPALADVAAGEILGAEVTRLEEWRLQALEMRIDADLGLGRHRDLVSELKTLTTQYPLHEAFQGKLMLALHRSGRRYEALTTYQRFRTVLADELGLEPSTNLARLQRALLSSDPSLEANAPTKAVVTEPAAKELSTPAQLPPGIADFVGHAGALGQVEGWISECGEDEAAVRLVSIEGGPGIGKTTLAVRAAHRLRSRFPGGQLYADLRGTGDKVADPAEILDQFLKALGVPKQQIPHTVEERSALFRTRTADRRMLVVLDDAASAVQVTPLVPGSAECAVIVTSRSVRLPGARSVALEPLDTDEAVSLLAKMIGGDRVSRELDAATEIVRFTGRVPLALRAVGARLVSTDVWPLGKLAEQLANPEKRLGSLRFGGFDVRASYDASVDRLSEAEKIAFVLLGLLPPGEFGLQDAVTLFGSTPENVESLFARLIEEHLLRIVRRGPDGALYHALDELGRLCARERLESVLGTPPPAVVVQPGAAVTEQRADGERNLILLELDAAGVFRARHLKVVGSQEEAEAALAPVASSMRNHPIVVNALANSLNGTANGHKPRDE